MSSKNFSSHSGVRAKKGRHRRVRELSVFELAAVLNRPARLRLRIPNKSMPRPHADPARKRLGGIAV